MKVRKPVLSRRRFLALGGTTLALAGVPLSKALATGGEKVDPTKIGGNTPNDRFYVTSYGGTPSVDVAAWSLKIHGKVGRPLKLSYDAIRRLPTIKQTLTLE